MDPSETTITTDPALAEDLAELDELIQELPEGSDRRLAQTFRKEFVAFAQQQDANRQPAASIAQASPLGTKSLVSALSTEGAAASEILALSGPQVVAQPRVPVVTPSPEGPPGAPTLNWPWQPSRNYQNWSTEFSASNVYAIAPKDDGVITDGIRQVAHDIARLVTWAANDDKRRYVIRPLGTSHNWSPLVVDKSPGGDPALRKTPILLDTSGLNWYGPVQQVNGHHQATFGTGLTLDQVLKHLQGVPLDEDFKALDLKNPSIAGHYGFQSMPAPGGMTLGGILAIGGHGSGIPWQKPEQRLFGSISNLIVDFTAIVAEGPPDATTGHVTYVAKRFSRSAPDAAAFLVHLGRALLVDVTLRVVPDYFLIVRDFYRQRKHFLPLAAPAPGPAGAEPNTLEEFLQRYGRVEVEWYSSGIGGEEMWIKTWERYDTSNALPAYKPDRYHAPQVQPPYVRYAWTADISKRWRDFASSIKDEPSVALVGIGARYNAHKNCKESKLADEKKGDFHHSNWGTSTQQLFVLDKTINPKHKGKDYCTPPAVVCSYAVLLPRADVQTMAQAFCAAYRERLKDPAYQWATPPHDPPDGSPGNIGTGGSPADGIQLWPANVVIELRFTSVDEVDDLGIPGATPPALAASRPAERPSRKEGDAPLDTVFWVSLIAFTGTQISKRFFAEMEAWIREECRAKRYIARPEWSKGYAYLPDKGAWSNPDVLRKHIPSVFADPAPGSASSESLWEWARNTLHKYDPKGVFTNDLLRDLFGVSTSP